ncbi:MAG: methyltransferase domain-containing protein [Acidobacteria bacterium]|nr:methyltransferase domain-containing protein [Acidobacteriota bacterium]
MNQRSGRELALRYDLLIAPLWGEVLGEWVEERLDLSEDARVLELNCGTGGLSVAMATSLCGKGEVIGVDHDRDRLELAEAKASVVKLQNLTFRLREADEALNHEAPYTVTIGDAATFNGQGTAELLAELVRRTAHDGQVGLKLITRGSFGEFFSIFWEALYDCDLTGHGGGVEALIEQFPTVSESQAMMRDHGLAHVHAYVEKKDFRFATAEEVFDFPLIEDYFVTGWFEFLPDPETRARVRERMVEIIHRETRTQPFDLSVKTTLLTGRKDL